MNRWADPRVYVTASLIGLFGYAFIENPADEAMKGALIAAFAAAYGYWIGASKANEAATENTGAAFRAIEATANASGTTDHNALRPGDTVTLDTPEGGKP